MGNEGKSDDTFQKNLEENKDRPKDDVLGNKIDPESGLKERLIEEILQIPVADHQGMQLVSAQLTRSNLLNWSKSIKRALAVRSKMKLLGFLTESQLMS